MSSDLIFNREGGGGVLEVAFCSKNIQADLKNLTKKSQFLSKQDLGVLSWFWYIIKIALINQTIKRNIFTRQVRNRVRFEGAILIVQKWRCCAPYTHSKIFQFC